VKISVSRSRHFSFLLLYSLFYLKYRVCLDLDFVNIQKAKEKEGKGLDYEKLAT